ncbi:MAG: SRPBCC family protein [Actinomycetes bacterium]
MNATLRTVDGRHELRLERTLAHPPEKVWRALTERDHLSVWFPFDVDMQPEVGGGIRFIDPGGGPDTTGEVTEYAPPSVLAFSWGDNLLRFALEPDGSGSRLVFTHTQDDRAGTASFASGWHVCFDAMERVLDEKPVEMPRPSDALHERYLAEFGLAEGTAEATPEGWRVRFERQLTRPAETVWATLQAAPDAATSGHRTNGDTPPPAVGDPVPPGFTDTTVGAGPVRAVEAPRLLEYDWQHDGRPAGRVRWELGAGTGHGARLVLTQTGPDDLAEARALALTAWREHVERLVDRLTKTSV